MRVIGLMSGTSYDAIDAAAADIRIDGGDTLVLTPLGMVSEPYSGELRAAVAAAVPPASTTVGQICQLDTEIGQAFAAVAARANEELCGGSAELISSHGQTMFHWVEGAQVKGTLQLGQPAWIAEKTGCTVVSDLRSRDVATGGQGAPLVSAFDVLWLNGRTSGSVALNLGGIANVTAPGGVPTSTADGAAVPIAFDTGPPANALIDAAVSEFTAGGAVVRSRRCSGRSGHTERRSARTTTERTVLRAARSQEHRQGIVPSGLPTRRTAGGLRILVSGRHRRDTDCTDRPDRRRFRQSAGGYRSGGVRRWHQEPDVDGDAP